MFCIFTIITSLQGAHFQVLGRPIIIFRLHDESNWRHLATRAAESPRWDSAAIWLKYNLKKKKLTQRPNEEIWREFPSDRRPIHFYDVSLAAHRYVSTGGAQVPAVASTVRALGRRFTKKITSRGHKKWANRLIKIVACGFCSFFFYFDQFAYDTAHIVAELCANSAWAEQHIIGRGTLLDSALDSTPISTEFEFKKKIFRWNGISIWSIY